MANSKDTTIKTYEFKLRINKSFAELSWKPSGRFLKFSTWPGNSYFSLPHFSLGKKIEEKNVGEKNK
ncbi:MAG: hypothetical protein MOB07_01410, partial [Acidobacteria bacterium]|nr:hypothetical protein [Acidobacteriota bacterium]